MRTTLRILSTLALSLLLGSVAEAAKQGPKGPKSGSCDPGDVLVCHLGKKGFKPVCADEPANHIPGHDGDVLADADGDGFLSNVCVASGDDCDDGDAAVHPGADDSACNGVDDDCDGTADDEYVAVPTTCGVGVCDGNTGEEQCQSGTVVDTCDPFAGMMDEECDGLDNDCDGSVPADEANDDGDAFRVCAGDCDDGNPAIHPGADDSACNGVDDDCDATADDEFVGTPTTCGVGECASTGVTTCAAGAEGNTCTEAAPATEQCDIST